MRGSGVYQTRQCECAEQSRELWEGLVGMVPERVRVTARRVRRDDSTVQHEQVERLIEAAHSQYDTVLSEGLCTVCSLCALHPVAR